MDFAVAHSNKREATVARFSSSICLPNRLKSSQEPSQKVDVYLISEIMISYNSSKLCGTVQASGGGLITAGPEYQRRMYNSR